jgi:hypothetical protein
MGVLEKIKQWFGQAASTVGEEAEGGIPVATPAPGNDSADPGETEQLAPDT